MCTEMMSIHDDTIGLWQLLFICKGEKTHLNDKVELGVYVFNELLQTNFKR